MLKFGKTLKNTKNKVLSKVGFQQSQETPLLIIWNLHTEKFFSTSTSDDLVLTNIKDKKSTPENKVVSIERQKRIVDAINKLKPKFKEVIMLCEINGYSYEECAKKLKCPVGTVKSRIYNAKKELAQKLEDLM